MIRLPRTWHDEMAADMPPFRLRRGRGASGQEALEDAVLRLLLRKTRGLQLHELIPRDAAGGGLMDQLDVHAVGGDLRHGADPWPRCGR